MEEKRNLSDEQLISELRNKRTVGRSGKALEIVGIIFVLIGFLTTLIPVAILGGILCLVGVLVMNNGEKAMKQQIGDQLVRGLLEQTFEQVEYEPTGHITSPAMGRGKTMLPTDFSEIEGSNHVKALYKGMHIEMSAISLVLEEDYYNDDAGMWEKIKKTVFNGQWLVCDFGHELSTELKIVARSGQNRLFSGSVIKTGNEEFDRRFIIQPEQEEEAGYILTPNIIAHILHMSSKYGGKIYMSFLREGKLHIAIETNQEFFAIGRGSVDVELLRNRYADEIRWFTGFIDELSWVDTFYQTGAGGSRG